MGLKNAINYWYIRYLLVTELFMVNKWERHMFHIIALILLTLLGLFNLFVVSGVGYLRQYFHQYTNGVASHIIQQIPGEL